jgi:protein-S-isoprenylcysteine O-methyltransferase Ste14
MTYSQWMRRYRRLVGIPFLIAALLLAHFQLRFLYPALALIFFGELLRIWASGHLKKEEILTTGGPYRFIRNPLYVGSLLIGLGFFLISDSYWVLLLIAFYFLISYVPVIRYEEEILKGKFPSEFPEYSQNIPAFFPALHPWKHPSTQFNWQQVWKNKEYNAIIGIVVVITLLALFRR